MPRCGAWPNTWPDPIRGLAAKVAPPLPFLARTGGRPPDDAPRTRDRFPRRAILWAHCCLATTLAERTRGQTRRGHSAMAPFCTLPLGTPAQCTRFSLVVAGAWRPGLRSPAPSAPGGPTAPPCAKAAKQAISPVATAVARRALRDPKRPALTAMPTPAKTRPSATRALLQTLHCTLPA